MFQQITINIYLSESMEQDMPKTGDEEIAAIEKHSAVIDRILMTDLNISADDLQQLGYTVTIDT